MMAHTLYLNDGTMRVVFNNNDFVELLRERIGEDAAEYFEGVIEDYEFELEQEKEVSKLYLKKYLYNVES